MDEIQPLVPTNLPADVHWGFTRDGLNSVLHHAHFIAMKRGAASAHMAANWPGLSLGEAISAARTAGALAKSRRHFSGYTVRRTLTEFHILHDETTRIVK